MSETSTDVVGAAEAIVLDLSRRLTRPVGGECLLCYVHRMVTAHGCDTTLRWAARFRDLTAPRATALEERLFRIGGFCDCEIFLNGVTLSPRLRVLDEHGEERWPRPAPLCRRVRPGSTQGCGNWTRQRRR